jgi:hypothetical protein
MVPSAVRPFPHDDAQTAVTARKGHLIRAKLADRLARDIDIL